MQAYGVPLRYYVDSLRVFRFVQGRDSVWRKHVLQTDDVDTQWGKMMRVLGVDVNFALSPQAKGKIERPYGWLQDRIVRTCIYENITTFEKTRSVRATGNSLFRPFSLPKPYTSSKDIFCLRETRMVNGYRRISLFNHKIEVPNVPLREYVEIHLVPDITRDVMDIRIWWNNRMVYSVTYPLKGFRVHF